MNKISVCTVCMNRLEFLKETLPRNISQNSKYDNLEFVLLNYNSKDDLDDWVRKELYGYIESGILKYYKTTEPDFFRISHSKNMLCKLASGDIFCMIDADNYMGPDYVGWVNSIFLENGNNAVVTTIGEKFELPFQDVGGKIAFSRELFYKVRGYDEGLKGYGMDDIDLVCRLLKAGGPRIMIRNKEYLQFIGHSQFERIRNH